MNNSSSPLEQLQNAIKNENPFNKELVVKKQNVWKKEFPHVDSINALAYGAVFKGIEEVRRGQRDVIGITIKAEPGLGKTHLLSRVRHKLQADGSAWFVYMTDYNDLNRIKPEFLKTLALSLKEVGSQGVTQWQELATDLANEGEEKPYTYQQLVNEVNNDLANNCNLINKLTDKVLEIKTDIDNPDLPRAILWTLSKQHAPYAINWLSGKSLAQKKADEMELPNDSEDDKDHFDITCQILDLISDYNPLVVCFDQLDGTECDDAGFSRAQVIASLATDLYTRLKRGVLLTAMYPETWTHKIRALDLNDGVADRVGEREVELKPLNSDHIVDIVSLRLKEFYGKNELTPPQPVYPFSEETLKELGKQRPTARDILKWCQTNWGLPNDQQVSSHRPAINPVDSAYNNEFKNIDNDEYMEDDPQLTNAIKFGLNQLIGQIVAGVTIEKIEAPVKPKNKYLGVKIVGKEEGNTVKIGLAVIQASVGNRVTTGLSHLEDYKKYDLTRGCLVRSKPISRKAKKAQECLNNLKAQGGKSVELKTGDIKPLIAIRAVYDSREDYELSEEQIKDFIANKKLAIDNRLLREILSAPSGQIPEEAVDEESES
ncbi:MAG: hypothetical protein F6K50_25550 [Moorea sp. SIO3I7]|uniref:hypothetical protein n=1 Tax=Moorena sp. SIO3I8 TaxID=2607833 RepID=UPI0013BED296|nr:hypothetical protein [Moorena sp. SIO3I8]NEN98747.1 hypothetical protein [Moorena sp. SIO3I7]NEO04722.1 hypothetical protein [Moorena sp. SIO3I8]